ncbi:hypothetical protein ACFC9R_14420 [Enterococcus casseliflavus]
MDMLEEKRNIYELMKAIAEERKILSQNYFELKEKLSRLENAREEPTSTAPVQTIKKNTSFQIEKESQRDSYFRNNKSSHFIPFEKVSISIVNILKKSDIPMSNSQLLESLKEEYGIRVSYSNLTSNILPKMNEDKSIAVEKAYRGYWQYRK